MTMARTTIQKTIIDTIQYQSHPLMLIPVHHETASVPLHRDRLALVKASWPALIGRCGKPDGFAAGRWGVVDGPPGPIR